MKIIFKTAATVVFFLTCFWMSGCSDPLKDKAENMKQIYKAFYTPQPVKIDGKLDDAIWQQTPSYPMQLSKDKTDAGRMLQEAGRVQFAWDDQYFYLAADFKDSDIIAQGMQDQMHHYLYGDVCELFLKPADETYYWELYVTPAGKKSCFFYPSRGYLGLPDCLEKCTLDLNVAAAINGTLNRDGGADQGFKVLRGRLWSWLKMDRSGRPVQLFTAFGPQRAEYVAPVV